MSASTPIVFLCNGAEMPSRMGQMKAIRLSCLKDDPKRLVNLKLPNFVDQLYYLPPRILDLLEIAAYVFAADRWTTRGPKDALEFRAWMRSMQFVIRVREVEFWNRPVVKNKLVEALVFMTGDREYDFEFLPGHSTPPTSLFDCEKFKIETRGAVSVTLFSGGLDSLGGVLDRLQSTNEIIYLISHRSGQPSTKRTQGRLAEALKRDYPGRVHHYSFECGLTRERPPEETQRTRAFLFSSIAFALAHRLSQTQFFAYENGVTSLNLLRRQDLINARASRTTHPKTLALMSHFLSEVHGESSVKAVNPFWNLTKTDVFKLVDQKGGRNLIGSTISCSKVFQRLEPGTHCGHCFQCIDRQLAAYAAGLQNVDDCGIYSRNIFTDSIDSPDARTTAVDYIRQATEFAKITDDAFYRERLNELVDIVDYIDAGGEQEAVEALWKLCNRHGKQVVMAIQEVRRRFDDPCSKVKSGSLLQLIADREHLKDDAKRLAERIAALLTKTIRIAFKTRRPAKEDEVNDQVDALLRADGNDFKREFPSTTFALAKVVPDHEASNADLLIETKFVRKGTTPSKVSDGIGSDITKYQFNKFILFVVYDPDGAISDDAKFKADIEAKRDSLVVVIR